MFIEWGRRITSRYEVMMLDDRALSDVGLTRSDFWHRRLAPFHARWSLLRTKGGPFLSRHIITSLESFHDANGAMVMIRFFVLLILIGSVAAPNFAFARGGPLSFYGPFSEHAMRISCEGLEPSCGHVQDHDHHPVVHKHRGSKN